MNLQRLRERKLVQWAVAYLAGAWLLLQLCGLLTDTFSWPQLVSQVATVLLAIGLVAALVIAFEKAVEAREDYVADLNIDPAYGPLHRNPRFQKLLAEIGLK